MRFRTFITQIFNDYFNRDFDVQILVYHLIVYIGIFAGLLTGAVTVVVGNNLGVAVVDFSIAALAYAMLRVSRNTKRYRLCSWALIIIFFFIVFPVGFFVGGGYRSSAAYPFIVALIITSTLLAKTERFVALAIQITLYVTCSVIAYYRPEYVFQQKSEFYYMLISTINFSLTSIIILTIFFMLTRLFNYKQERMEELNRELLARSETLIRYDKMKSDFLSTVAHEINTPLAVISASSSDTLDLMDESPMNMGEIRENQNIIVKRVKLIDNIILDLMDAVAIENGRLSINRQPENLSALLRNIGDAQFKQLDNNNNRLVYDMKPDLKPIWLDPARIEQVITNLLSNAVHYTRDGVVTIRLEQAEERQIVRVEDNGAGMDEEMARIALRQYVSTKADYWRHGIGLYICRRIIAAHGGEIWIDSTIGVGTTISFSLRERSEYV